MISFNLFGVEKTQRALGRTNSMRTKLMRSPYFASRTAARKVREAMKDEVPTKTGNLADSIKSVIEHGEQSTVRFQMASYAKYVIEGTNPHEIWPVEAAILSNYSSGGDFIAAFVLNHPGNTANDFRKKAWLGIKPEIHAMMHRYGLKILSSSTALTEE